MKTILLALIGFIGLAHGQTIEIRTPCILTATPGQFVPYATFSNVQSNFPTVNITVRVYDNIGNCPYGYYVQLFFFDRAGTLQIMSATCKAGAPMDLFGNLITECAFPRPLKGQWIIGFTPIPTDAITFAIPLQF